MQVRQPIYILEGSTRESSEKNRLSRKYFCEDLLWDLLVRPYFSAFSIQFQYYFRFLFQLTRAARGGWGQLSLNVTDNFDRADAQPLPAPGRGFTRPRGPLFTADARLWFDWGSHLLFWKPSWSRIAHLWTWAGSRDVESAKLEI